MQALDLGIEICYAISRPLLACAKAYILMQKGCMYKLNYNKLFSKEEFFTGAFVIIILIISNSDNFKTFNSTSSPYGRYSFETNI